jgi:hypothetical protein
LNDFYQANHIAFFIQAHKVIDQVVNGDISNEVKGDLTTTFVKVERVVDIVQNLFKTNAAMVLLEGTPLLEVPFN